MACPEPFTVNAPLLKLALPANPIAPISKSVQLEGSGALTTLRTKVVDLLRLPDIPVIVSAKLPATAVLLAVTVNVLVLAVIIGLKEALTPCGKPATDRFTLPVNPF